MLAAALVAVLLASCAHAEPPVIEALPPAVITEAQPQVPIAAPVHRGPVDANAVVVHVSDGDTILVADLDGASKRSVRLGGIDTPESKKPNTPVECFALEAAAALASLLPIGTPVRLVNDVEKLDRYGRELAYVYRSSDGLFVNFEMVRTGMAATLSIAPNVAHASEFRVAARSAREQRVGLWSACDGEHEPAPKN